MMTKKKHKSLRDPESGKHRSHSILQSTVASQQNPVNTLNEANPNIYFVLLPLPGVDGESGVERFNNFAEPRGTRTRE